MVFRRLLRPVRNALNVLFYKFGLHCATNQVRVIMISDLVITSLLYPALAIYFSSQPLSHYSTRLHDSLFALGTRTDTTPTDLRDIWEGYDTLHIREETGVQARCGTERTIRLERVLVPGIDPMGSLSKQSLLAALRLQQQIDDALTNSSGNDLLRCVTDPEKEHSNCLVYGPLMCWDSKEVELLQDINVIATLNSQQNISKAGIPFDLEMTLGGRGPKDGRGWVHDAEFLALTYFFFENDCHTNARHSSWLNVLTSATSAVGGTIRSTAHPPKLIALEYDVIPRKNRISLLTITVYLAYFTLVGYFSGPLRKMDTVHSRFGLAFTGIVEIVASTITSVSVCALWGFRVTMVPWGILPVMIVFVGAEDMFSLVQAVVATSISLPVKERIALGLSQAGASNTLKVACYNAIFGTIAVFSTGAIRQFCIFTVVVLVAHWFLIHTFFVAVLAIDIQRLDLADFLRQGPRHIPSKGSRPSQHAKDPPAKNTTERLRSFRKDRLAKNGSFVLLLAMIVTLYFVSSPFPASLEDANPGASYNAARSSLIQSLSSPFPTAMSEPPIAHDIIKGPPPSPSLAQTFWTIFNPNLEALLHLRVESPALFTLPNAERKTEDVSRQPSRAIRNLIHGLRPFVWIFRVLVLPISCTALALYALMLYLLKDADLVDSQRHRLEAGSTRPSIKISSVEQAVNRNLSLLTLPRAFIADVELGAVSRDGSVVVTTSVHNEIMVWTHFQAAYHTVDLGLLVTGNEGSVPQSVISAIVLDETGSRCAIGFDDGLVVQWTLGSGVKSKTSLRDGTRTAVAKLLFCSAPAPSDFLSSSSQRPISNSEGSHHLLVAHATGETYAWSTMDEARAVALKTLGSPRNMPPSLLLTESKGPQVTFALEDGGIEIHSAPQEVRGVLIWESKVVANDGTQDDPVVYITSNAIHVGPAYRELVALARQSGRVEVHDAAQGTLVALIVEGYEVVSKIALAPVEWKTCQHCGEKEVDGFVLALSCYAIVHVHKVVVPLQANRCACPMSRLLNTFGAKTGSRDKHSGRQSRSGSMVSSSTSSPRANRHLLPSTSTSQQTLDYPMAGHGYHSRRISEKDAKERSRASTESMNSDDLDSIDVPWSDPFAPPSRQSALDTSSTPRAGFAWSNSRAIKILEISCDRGGWGASGLNIVGMRRRSRQSENEIKHSQDSKRSRSNGTSTLPLARWEIWTFNASEDTVRISSLASLEATVITPQKKSEFDGNEQYQSSLVRRNSSLRRLLDLKRKDDAARISGGEREVQTISSNITYPILSFTQLFPVEVVGQTLLAGLGNTVGLVDLSCFVVPSNVPPPSRKASFARSDTNPIERKRQ